jgi:hypothetical protein
MQVKQKKRTIDDEVTHILDALGTMRVDSEEYQNAARNLKEICDARSKPASRLVSSDTIVLAATNLAGILLILHYEQVHVVASKALAFVVKRI